MSTRQNHFGQWYIHRPNISVGYVILTVLTAYLAVGMHFFIPNMGGTGLSLPQNAIAWIVMSLCVLSACAGVVVHRAPVVSGRVMKVAALAVGLMILPWLWDPSTEWKYNSLMRLAALFGALAFLWALLQLHITPVYCRIIATIVLISALIEAIIGMIQAWLPDLSTRLMIFHYSSPYGVFQQRNVYASWMATGCGVALWLGLVAKNRCLVFVCRLCLFPLTTALVLTESRIGALGLLVMLIVGSVAVWPGIRYCRPAQIRYGIFLLLLCLLAVCISRFAMPVDFAQHEADFAHTASSAQRIRVLKGAVNLVSAHPLLGNGLGSFEALFPHALESCGLTSLESDTVTHPHNELLYTWAEGGIFALSGLILLTGLWLWPVVWHLRHRNSTTIPGGWLLALTGLPIIMHTQTEYPLYQSVPHLMVLLLLYRISLPHKICYPVKFSSITINKVTVISGGVGIILSAMTVLVLVAGLGTQNQLTQVEHELADEQLMSTTLPHDSWATLTQSSRLEYDRHMASLLIDYPRNADPKILNDFYVWGAQFQRVHNDAEVSAAMMEIARRYGDIRAAEIQRQQAQRVFVHDSRFNSLTDK